MLYEIMKSIKNFFPDTTHQITGRFTISDNVIEPFVSLNEGQYFLIEGSSVNDGVYTKDAAELTDEEFYGTITPLKIPKAFLSLAEEIEAWEQKNGEAASSVYQSESFGGYSYSKGSYGSGVTGWQSAFRSKLNAWRKI